MNCIICEVELKYSGKGRKPTYCPEHARTAKKALDRARPRGGHKERTDIPQCCLDARAAGVVRSGDGRDVFTGTVYKCEEHKEAARIPVDLFKPVDNGRRSEYGDDESYVRAEHEELPRTPVQEFIADGGFRLTTRKRLDYIIPDPKLEYRPSGTKNGYDAELEAETKRWLDKTEDDA